MHYKDLGRYFKRYYRTVLEKKRKNKHKKSFSFFRSCLPVECGQTVSGCESVVQLPGVRGGRTVWMVATARVRLSGLKKNQKPYEIVPKMTKSGWRNRRSFVLPWRFSHHARCGVRHE